jgi:hypothetical protein
MRVSRWVTAFLATACLTLAWAQAPATAAPRPVAVASAGDVAALRQPPPPSTSDLAADYMLIIAGVGAWATLTVWLATRHRRRLWAAFGRAAAGVGDEAEEWLRDQ